LVVGWRGGGGGLEQFSRKKQKQPNQSSHLAARSSLGDGVSSCAWRMSAPGESCSSSSCELCKHTSMTRCIKTIQAARYKYNRYFNQRLTEASLSFSRVTVMIKETNWCGHLLYCHASFTVVHRDCRFPKRLSFSIQTVELHRDPFFPK
jgi:hypothetical protein